jgi:glycosyltransferase involved in cell wall biosynthesis
MKLLFISTMFYPEVISGGQISSFQIAKTQVGLGHKVTVLTLSSKKHILRETIEGIDIIRISYEKKNLLHNMDLKWFFMAKMSLKYIKSINPDIIHIINFEPILLTPIAIKLNHPRLPIVTTVNGPLFGCFTQNSVDYKGDTCVNCRVIKRGFCTFKRYSLFKGMMYYLYSFWYMSLLRLSYRSVDRFFTVSKSMDAVLLNMGVKQSRIKTIYNPIEMPKKSKKDKEKINAKYGLTNKRLVLFAGRLAKEKGIDRIIRAIKSIQDANFFIVGNKTGDYVYLKTLVHELKLERRVRFLGFMEHEALQELYSITDLVVLPETFYEPLSRLLLESASYGIPLIATDVGGNSEIIEHGKNGYLIKDIQKLPDLMAELLTDNKKSALFGEYSKEKIRENFSKEKIGKRLEKEYRLLLDKSL